MATISSKSEEKKDSVIMPRLTDAVEIKDRVMGETPTFFVKTSNWGLIIAGAGLVIKIAAAIFPATMPIGLVALAPEIIGFGSMIAVGAQMPKRDKADKTPLRKTLITKIIDWFR